MLKPGKLFILTQLLVVCINPCHAQNTLNDNSAQYNETPVEERAEKEETIPPNYFAIVFYKPTYLLPYYYTGSPYVDVYRHNTPNGERTNRSEIKYQLSFKVPAWKNIFNYSSTLYLAYTQLSYWQAYNRTAFFRETDFEPELFIANETNIPIFREWKINFVNLGATHQSNGFGGTMERSWNRVYLEAISSTDQWMISLKPWLVIHDHAFRSHNPNMTNFLGFGQLLIAYKFYNQVFSVTAHNLLENGGKHATFEGTWSFPITAYLNGYVQVFSGYGQSLIEYDHQTTSAGLGVAFSNWI